MMRHLLVFPVLAVVLAFVSFVFGGHCAAWQWWIAVMLTVASGFWRSSAKEGIRSGALFLGWLALFWVGCGVFAGPAWIDEVAYHFPAVRMLAGGWNPLWNCSPESALASAGLELGDCWIDHIVFMPKPVWTFDAVAWFFTRDVLNPLSPVLWFLFPAVVGRVWRSLAGTHVVWKMLSVPILYCLVPCVGYTVDAVVALSAIGLFLCFEEILSDRGFDRLSLVVYSFWMMGAKTPGLLHGGFFWAVFLIFVLWRQRSKLRRLLGVSALVAVLLALVCSTPYLTSIHDYGHPFYPKYSFDEKRFPVRDLTHDFITERNDDAAQMSYCGLYVNAFISPSLARAWYRWRLARPDFMPYSRNYGHYPNDSVESSSPIRRSMRCLFWLSVAWLFFGAGKSWRIPALSVLLCMGAAPPQMLGYLRYIPWWFSPALFAYIDISRRGEKWSRRALCMIALALICMVKPHTLLNRLTYAATLVDRRLILSKVLEKSDNPPVLRAVIEPGKGHLKLLLRHVNYSARPRMLPYSRHHREVAKRERLEIAACLFVLDDLDEMRRVAFRYPVGRMSCVAYVVRTNLVTLPCAAVDRIASLWRQECYGEGGFE
ncbi:MAG: hypothetical protein J6W66_03900 [Lachnospiraceae bacterium]|nr:hypothetical protein [Lachnospiraceae bacterium]